MTIIFSVVKDVLAAIGFISTAGGIHDLYQKFTQRRAEKADAQRKLELLRVSEHFVANIVQIGGEGSRTYSLTVTGETKDEGGYCLTPAGDFVSIGFTRGGLMTVNPTSLAEGEGFGIDSIASKGSEFTKYPERRFCHLLQPHEKNVYRVKFARLKKAA
jgi:hypothetical protein